MSLTRTTRNEAEQALIGRLLTLPPRQSFMPWWGEVEALLAFAGQPGIPLGEARDLYEGFRRMTPAEATRAVALQRAEA